MGNAKTALFLVAVLPALAARSSAGVWTEMGDAQTRSDIEMAVAGGVLDNITTQGPQVWSGILGRLQNAKGNGELPAGVREAAERLLVKGTEELDVHRPHLAVTLDVTNQPADVRGYDALARGKGEASVAYEYIATSTAVHVAVGSQWDNRGDKQRLVLDGSYIAQRLDNAVIYAGWLSHWWGPGWISALEVSNNARPMPQIGITRLSTQQSDSWLLSWMGPWQFDGFVGLLDGPREARDTAFIAMHFAFSPLPGLEIGLARTTQMCGSGHVCRPLTEYFTFSNDPNNPNQTNDEASIELRYTNIVLSHPFAVYAQFMNEDSNPIVHSSTSRLFGGSVWLPVEGLTGRLTLEYANSIATNDIWGGGAQHGIAYNNGGYVDGMRYRGRTLGFSLDSDSVLYSLQASIVDPANRTYTLTYHRALVSNPLNPLANVVTTAPVRFNAVELRTAVPVAWGDYKAKVDVAARWQDDQPRPRGGSQLAFEIALKCAM
jgi:hypothetical protein